MCFHHHTPKIPNARTGMLHCLLLLDLQDNTSGFRPRKWEFLWCLSRTWWIWILRTWTRPSALLYVATSCGSIIRSLLRNSAQFFFFPNILQPKSGWFWCSESTGACHNVCLCRRSSRLSKTWFLALANSFSFVIAHRTWIPYSIFILFK